MIRIGTARDTRRYDATGAPTYLIGISTPKLERVMGLTGAPCGETFGKVANGIWLPGRQGKGSDGQEVLSGLATCDRK